MSISPQLIRAIKDRIDRLEWRARGKVHQPQALKVFASDAGGLISGGPLPPGISLVSIPAGRFVASLHPQLEASSCDHSAAWDAYLHAAAQAAADGAEIPDFHPPPMASRIPLAPAPAAPSPVARLAVAHVVKLVPKKTKAQRDEEKFERRFGQ